MPEGGVLLPEVVSPSIMVAYSSVAVELNNPAAVPGLEINL